MRVAMRSSLPQNAASGTLALLVKQPCPQASPPRLPQNAINQSRHCVHLFPPCRLLPQSCARRLLGKACTLQSTGAVWVTCPRLAYALGNVGPHHVGIQTPRCRTGWGAGGLQLKAISEMLTCLTKRSRDAFPGPSLCLWEMESSICMIQMS